MDKKPLIVVSLCAVVLLVLGSLSNVVGYQTVKSTVNVSPLFSTRTQRATNQQQNILTSQYLGMGEGSILQFPIRDNRTEQLKKTIDIINKMDDKTFARFTELCIQKARQDDTLRDLNRSQIVQTLLLLKTNPKAILNSFTSKDNHPVTSSEWFSLCQQIFWFDCIAGNILFLIFATIFFVCFIIVLLISGPTAFTCISYCMCLN
ncbi:hypothetical protein AYK25_09770 [Thermoplasmatales archaeon SM1-50]|nr:MAG: hypothetical protein AYK25_09770 [Thermoplasmatales archaeon SM1-50]